MSDNENEQVEVEATAAETPETEASEVPAPEAAEAP